MLFYNLCKLMGHDIHICHTLLKEHITYTYRVQEEEGFEVAMQIHNTLKAYNPGKGQGMQGRGWGF